MKYSAKQYAEALYDSVTTTAPADRDKVLDNFVSVLAKNNDTRMFEHIAEEFHKLELKAKGQIQANVTTATPLSPESEKKLIHELNDLVNGQVELKKKIDQNIVGGVIVQMEDTVIDASVKRSLEDLKKNLTKE